MAGTTGEVFDDFILCNTVGRGSIDGARRPSCHNKYSIYASMEITTIARTTDKAVFEPSCSMASEATPTSGARPAGRIPAVMRCADSNSEAIMKRQPTEKELQFILNDCVVITCHHKAQPTEKEGADLVERLRNTHMRAWDAQPAEKEAQCILDVAVVMILRTRYVIAIHYVNVGHCIEQLRN